MVSARTVNQTSSRLPMTHIRLLEEGGPAAPGLLCLKRDTAVEIWIVDNLAASCTSCSMAMGHI